MQALAINGKGFHDGRKMQCYDLTFRGLRAPVRLNGIPDPMELLKSYFQKWPFTLSEPGTAAPFVRIDLRDGLYQMTSMHYDTPRTPIRPKSMRCVT